MVSKGPHLLLDAFGRLRAGSATVELLGAQADYHGDASYRTVLAPFLTLPGVHARGPQSREQVATALRRFDVLVVPSIWPETSPLVIREALLAGVPVVASNIGGIPEAVEHERNGLLFEPGNADDLARMLTRLLDEPGLLQRLKTGAAATTVRTLDEDVTATRRLYSSLIEQRTASRAPRVSKALELPADPHVPRGATPLAAIVLNYRTPADTAIAVGSLLASDSPPDRVFVVDNDVDSSCRQALAHFGDAVILIQTGTNLGFSGGMNVGIRAALDAGAALVLLVNSDVFVPPDAIAKLTAALATDDRIGIVGPLVASRAVPDVVGSAGIDYNLQTGRMRHRSVGADVAAVREPRGQHHDVAAVSGCLMLVKRAVFDRVGLLDERYFFSFEEIDFCLRARAAGFTTVSASDAIAYHHGGQSIGPRSIRRLYFAARNHLMLAAAHPAVDRRLTRAARSVFVAGLNLAHAVRAPGGSLPARLAATVRGIYDYVRMK
jgi:GT2 family glycosyltransferase